MTRTRLSDQYAKTLDGRVRIGTDRLVKDLAMRMAEHLWLHYPGARRMLITIDDVTGRAEPMQILGDGDKPLWSVDGPGWEPGGDNGPLHSLKPGDAADRHGARIHHDIALLGTLLPEGTQWHEPWPGQGIRSTVPGADWEIILPTSTDRLQHLAEVRLDKEAEASVTTN